MKIYYFIYFIIGNILLINSYSFKRYLPSIPPSNDIRLLTMEQTSQISKQWLHDIVNDVVHKEQKKMELQQKPSSGGLFEIENIHIVNNINVLESFIQNYGRSGEIFLGWTPRHKKDREEVLFILVAKHNTEKNYFEIKHLVQSPYWDSNQIESIYLKLALLEVTMLKNYSALDLSELYYNSPRYHLAWETWFAKMNQTTV